MNKTIIKRAIFSGLVTGAIAFVMLVVSVFLNGQTFGQRCAILHENGSPEWNQCVERLSAGKPLT